MFGLAIIIGIYSYTIFFLGLSSLLYRPVIVAITTLFFSLFFFHYRVFFLSGLQQCSSIFKKIIPSKISLFLFSIIILQAFVNLIGALGSELAFDALWYHLTLPKIYLINHKIVHIPGGLLYYSDMPKLTEMIYTATLALNDEILAKLIHFSFGILTCIALYKLSRKFFSSTFALICVVIFYSNLVVGWQSITAYVDLTRTFFEVMALWGFINWAETKEKKWLIESAVMVGLAISTKLLAIGSIGIFLTLILINDLWVNKKSQVKKMIINSVIFLFFSLLIPLPWFIFSLIHTGNPVHPFFTSIYKTSLDWQILNPVLFIKDIWQLFTHLADPISPIYIIILPLVVLLFKRIRKELKLVVWYSFLAIIIWYLTPRTGGGRFILPYLPAFSIIVAGAIGVIREVRVKKILVGLVVVVSLISIVYRGVANAKYLPVILGKQTKSEFLTNNLNFSFGDFYDTDDYFRNNIKASDKVLLYGFHNLYYVDFPFIDASWIEKGTKFNYIAVQNFSISERFKYWDLIYQNPKTGVKLYSLGRKEWVY